jgi:alginate O-acetyltransferase complex protein AlgI
LSFGTAWLGLTCYTLQIYFDFSGYSDMAIGMGRMFGFQFLENFNYPYTAVSIQDFWRRWHISLSTWFRDYLYIPLGGSKHSTAHTYGNLIIVFFLCGFWHGASWTFVVWGLWHGLFLVVERLRNKAFMKLIEGPLSHLYVLSVVMIGWVFFRAESLDYALNYLKALSGLSVASTIPLSAYAVNTTELILASIVGIVGSTPIAKRLPILAKGLISRESTTYSANALIAGTHGIMLAAVFLLSVVSLAGGSYNPFIYFRF